MINEKEKRYFDRLLKNKAAKKQIAVYLDDAKVERIDMVIKFFSSISDSKSFARNSLIEEAVDKFLDESIAYLKENYEIDVEAAIREAHSEKYDTLILSSKGRGFEETFLGEEEPPCWYPCRISEEREKHLKYIAIYRGQPVSAITHYARIKEFHYDEEKGCKVCYFSGDAIELEHKVNLGEKDPCYFIGPKYTTLESLLKATRTDELVFG